ncbi:MAG: hypothetical protein EOO22_15680 [Comamonadaceae bacterium]|nr:MAG: hypothetical protein EOO22_15680 [Comamonadaceae bacterium]
MRRPEHLFIAACASLLLAACGSTRDTSNPDWAQAGVPPAPKLTEQDRDWTETEAPAPPTFVESRTLPIEMPPYMTLKFAVDPGTIAITNDGLVRYVVVASRPGGATNAFYEGVRCATAEVKTYARYNGGAWQAVKEPQWKRFQDLNASYVQQLASQGLCRGNAPRANVADMVLNMRQPVRQVQ